MLDETKLNESEHSLWKSSGEGTSLLDALGTSAQPTTPSDFKEAPSENWLFRRIALLIPSKKQNAKIIMPSEWPAVRDAMKTPPALVEHLVPAKANTLLHGSPGVGKSGLIWSLANAVTEGKDFLGLKTTKANCLLISVDMNAHELKQRWGTDFFPLFPFITPQKFDLRAGFSCLVVSGSPLFVIMTKHQDSAVRKPL